MINTIQNEERFQLVLECLELYFESPLNEWISVKQKSLSNILKDKKLHKSIASSIYKILLSSGILEKRGATLSTEYKILRKPTNFNEIIEQILNDNSKVRNKEYNFGKERLELGKKYYMVFNNKIFEVQVVGINIKKNNELFYNVKKKINSTSKTTILKNVKYIDIFLTVTSAGDQVKTNAIKDCKFIL